MKKRKEREREKPSSHAWRWCANLAVGEVEPGAREREDTHWPGPPGGFQQGLDSVER